MCFFVNPVPECGWVTFVVFKKNVSNFIKNLFHTRILCTSYLIGQAEFCNRVLLIKYCCIWKEGYIIHNTFFLEPAKSPIAAAAMSDNWLGFHHYLSFIVIFLRDFLFPTLIIRHVKNNSPSGQVFEIIEDMFPKNIFFDWWGYVQNAQHFFLFFVLVVPFSTCLHPSIHKNMKTMNIEPKKRGCQGEITVFVPSIAFHFDCSKIDFELMLLALMC